MRAKNMRGSAPIHSMLLLSLLWPLTAATYSLASEPPADSGLRLDLRNCLEIPSALRRLDCFDRLARSTVNDTPTVSRGTATPPENGRSDDGVTGPHAGPTPGPSADRTIRSSLKRLEQRPRGEWVFHLQNGQIWTEIEPGRARYEEGAEVRISRTLFGSHMLSAEGIRSTRVRRLE